MTKTIYIKTFGCQMNEYDSERLETLAAQQGFIPIENEKDASLVVINTCSIREKAEAKLMGFLGVCGKLKKQNPNKMIVVSGCVAQQEGEKLLKRAPYIDLVLGTDQVDHFDIYLQKIMNEKTSLSATSFLPRKESYRPETMPTGRKSFVAIMKGCDKVCTYCIVPFTRGREKSRPLFEVLHEVRFLVDQGHKEVTLIGQNVNSYGRDLGRLQFAELLHEVHNIEGLEQIRFTTSHPIDLSDDLIDAFATLPKLASNFHLPVQAGNNRILQEMRREYTIEWYLDRLFALRKARPEIAISTDLIVGFPGETEEDFEDTMKLLEIARYDAAYSFIYSARPYTRAAKMKNEVPRQTQVARLQRLQKRLLEISLELNMPWVGRTVSAYVEGPSKNKKDRWTARMSQNKVIHFDPDLCQMPPRKRDIIELKLIQANATSFFR